MDSFVEEDQNSWSVWIIYDSILYVLESYGWHLLILLVVLTVIYNKTLKSSLEKYRQYKFEKEYSAKYHKNPDVFATHVNAQQKWAEKMQEKYNREMEEHQRKLKEREEKKRQALIENNQLSSGGYVLGNDNNDHKKLRPEYNPLSGSGNSSSYRPPRRSPCGGGGCGR